MMSRRIGRQFTAQQREVYKNAGGTPSLDGNYTVYGIVLEGMDVVDKIVNMPRDNMDRPNTDIAMKKVYLVGETMQRTDEKIKVKNKKDKTKVKTDK